MEQPITTVYYEGKEIILLATAHVSKASVALVKTVIEREKPDSVCVELDEGRYQTIQNPKGWEETDVIQVIKNKKVGFLLANLVLSSYQKKMAAQLDSAVGGEMIQGIESAKECQAELVLADRDLQLTFKRIWRELSLWEKGKLLVSLFMADDDHDELTEESLADLMAGDMLASAMAEMNTLFPAIGQILLHERDMYLAAKIKQAPGTKVVAILGGAHVPGVAKEIFKDQDLDAITTIRPKSPGVKLVGWLFPLLIVGLLLYSFFVSWETGFQQLSTWLLWNSGLAALFTLVALGHPLTIITAFVTAPIGTMHPLLAVGWFAGLVEATTRKPTVNDLQRIQTDVLSLKGFFKNRALRILLVVIMANLGGTIGNIIGGMDMMRQLFS